MANMVETMAAGSHGAETVAENSHTETQPQDRLRMEGVY